MAMINVVLLTVLVAMAIERMRLTENHGDGDAYGAYLGSEQNDDDGHGGGCSDDGYAGGGCTRDTDDDGDRSVHASWEGGTDGDYEDVRVGNADDGANPGSEADGVCVTHGDADDLVVGDGDEDDVDGDDVDMDAHHDGAENAGGDDGDNDDG